MNRRKVLKAAVAATAVVNTLKSSYSTAAQSKAAGNGLKIGGYDYDRVRAIMDGKAGVAGYDVQFETSNIYSLVASAFGKEQTYDVTEIGLLPFIKHFINNDFRDYILIPVFISRTFRHRNVYVRSGSGIEKPEDLRARRIGTPGYGFSSHTWIRGFLLDEYGVRPEEMEWIETRESSDGGAVRQELDRGFLPDDFPLKKGPPGVDESELLISDGCDALITAITPRAFMEGDPRIRQLFPNVRAAERAYFEKTRVFPIMHAVAVRTELAVANPMLPKMVFEMYSKAKQVAYDRLASTTSLHVTLPWSNQEFNETRALMGENYWSYGIRANRREIDLALRYSYEQGLTKRRGAIEEIFHPSTLDLVKD